MLIHPWESGRDNAVEWDGPLRRVLPEITVLHRRDTDSVDAAERPTDEHYRRFLTLVRQGMAAGWDQARLAESGEFRVLDGAHEPARALRRQLLDAVAGGGMWEYFVPESGRGLGARDFTWTAALVLHELGSRSAY